MPWAFDIGLDTLSYAEFNNHVPLAYGWPSYSGIQDHYKMETETFQYTDGLFIQGNLWLKDTVAPFHLGLT